MIYFYRTFIKPGHLCYDIGANIGKRTEIFLSLGASVIAAEPQEHCLSFLCAIARRYPDTVIISAALGEAEGEAEMMICDEADECSSLSPAFMEACKGDDKLHWTQRKIVKLLTLDSLIEKYGVPHFIKIDVEGYEYNVVQGLSVPVCILSFEFTRAMREDTIKVLKYMAKLGTYECNFIEYESMHFRLAAWISVSKFMEEIDVYLSANVPTGEIFMRRMQS